MRNRVRELADRLETHYGDLGWWPAETPFEVAVGAVLTQNTAWRNVERAIAGLRAAGLLEPVPLAQAPRERIATAIRPAGYFRQKSQRLQLLAAWWLQELGTDAEARPAPERATAALRESLLALKGIGPETADSILLYAFARPVFVVDAYTARLVVRQGLLVPPFGYAELQALFHEALPAETERYNRLHAQIVEHAKRYCTKRNPRCKPCPLAEGCLGPEAELG